LARESSRCIVAQRRRDDFAHAGEQLLAGSHRAQAAEDVGGVRVLVAVENREALAEVRGKQLDHGSLAAARLADQEDGLFVLDAALDQRVDAVHGRRPDDPVDAL
jgi:hypothetical protein